MDSNDSKTTTWGPEPLIQYLISNESCSKCWSLEYKRLTITYPIQPICKEQEILMVHELKGDWDLSSILFCPIPLIGIVIDLPLSIAKENLKNAQYLSQIVGSRWTMLFGQSPQCSNPIVAHQIQTEMTQQSTIDFIIKVTLSKMSFE